MAIRVSKTHNWTFETNRHWSDVNPWTPIEGIWNQKEALVAVGGVVKRSSTRLAVGDGDLWLTPSDIRDLSGGHFSWAVITMPNGSELYIQVNASVYVAHGSSAGGLYTGGTTNTKPTASDEVFFTNTMSWAGNNTTGCVLNTMYCDNGTIRMIQIVNNAVVRHLSLEFLESPSPHLNGGVIHRWTNLVPTYAHLTRTDSYKCFIAGGERNARLTCEGLSGLGLGEVWNSPDQDGDYPCVECNALCVTPTYTQRLGKLPDFYMGSSSGIAFGDTYSSTTTSKEYVQFDHVLFPWDNLTIPRLA